MGQRLVIDESRAVSIGLDDLLAAIVVDGQHLAALVPETKQFGRARPYPLPRLVGRFRKFVPVGFRWPFSFLLFFFLFYCPQADPYLFPWRFFRFLFEKDDTVGTDITDAAVHEIDLSS